MSQTDSLVLAERDGPGVTLTLNRPDARNPLSWELVRRLAAALRELELDDEVRGVILTGAGKAFSAGGDLKAQAERQSWSVPQRVLRQDQMIALQQAIWRFPKPLVAAVNGVAAGAGAGLALLCDIRYASEDARFGFPFARVGLGPDYGVSYTLPRLVGPGRAARLLFTGGDVEAREAHAIGLCEQVCPADDLLGECRELIEQIAKVGPFGVQLAKAGLRRSADLGFDEALRAEFASQHLAQTTDDHLGALKAFAEKRPATFENR